MFKRTYKIKKLHKGELRDLEDVILIERPVTIKINTYPMVSIICLPKDIKELAVGFLFTAGFIDSIEEIEDVKVDELENEVHVTLDERKGDSIKDFETSSYNRVIKTSCGIPSVWRDLILNSIDKTSESLKDVKVPQELIFNCIVKMQSETILFKETGGCHGSALFDLNGELINLFEDIGRHNAIDKVIGSALIKNIDLTETILCSTGRLTGDSVLKAARSRIPIIASISAPIESGVRIAFSYGVTLIGFVRGNKMNIYSNPERIVV
jgi:FdhD protein